MAPSKIKKSVDIQCTREFTGWAYADMKWLSESEAKEADRKRNELLKSISGKVESLFNGNKISTGLLSPGCMTCGQGTWSCLFVGSLCTANCFYCPQDRKTKKDAPPTANGILFDNPEDYVDYLEKFKFTSVSFSGGEPFLQYEKILTYIKTIRARLGKGIYIWAYTNGDLVDEKKLHALKAAGLNELRFDIAARKYDLKTVAMAAGIIKKVSVEIPAIPEDFEILKKCLPRMKAAGVAHLNLHQLHGSQYCYKQFAARGYTFLHQPETAILESEMTALKILHYALEKNIGLPINYCCVMYKHRLQKKGCMERFQPFVKEEYEWPTESGFLRRLAVQDKTARLKDLVKIFCEHKCPARFWHLDKNNTELSVHQSLLKYIDFTKHDLIITYCAPHLAGICADDETSKRIALNANRILFAEKALEYRIKIKSPVTLKGFQELCIEKKNDGDVLKRFYTDYPLKTKADIDKMMQERNLLDYLKTWEFIGSGLYDIY